MKAAQEGYQASRAAATGQQAAANLVAGRAFLASNAENEGVVQTPDGLQYRILRTGSGAKPAADDRVVVHYRGRLIDGTEFDSSYRRGEPIEFMVGAVIPGWQAALQAMPAGSHWEVWIPAALAYGERGAGGIIGPNQALHFEYTRSGTAGPTGGSHADTVGRCRPVPYPGTRSWPGTRAHSHAPVPPGTRT